MNISKKTKYLIWGLWILIYPLSMWLIYNNSDLTLSGYEIDLISFLLLTALLSILPIVVNGTPILFIEGASLFIFLYFGLFVEIIFTQVAAIILLVGKMRIGLKDLHRIPLNLLMFLLVSLAGGGVYYMLGGAHGAFNITSTILLMPIIAYELTKFLANHTLLYLIRKGLLNREEPFFSNDLKWEGYTKLFHFPIALLLYILYVQIGLVALLYVGIPLLSLSIILRLYYSSERINSYLQKTSEIGQQLAGRLHVDEVFDLFIEKTTEMLPVDYGYIIDVVDSKELHVIRYFEDGQVKPVLLEPITKREGIIGNVWTSKKAILLNTKKELLRHNDNYLPGNVESVISVPVIRNQQVIGILVFASTQKRAYEKYQLTIVDILASYLGVATENAKHHMETKNLSERCALTQLYNFGYFEQLLEKEFLKLDSNDVKSQLSLILLDLDHFKTVNDTYGHQAGNDILIELADRLVEVIGDIGTVARYGGEEFVILLPDTDKFTCHKIAETIRQMIANRPFTLNDDLLMLKPTKVMVRITASIGFATAPLDADEPMALIRHADRAMYTGAKQAGRNRVAEYVK